MAQLTFDTVINLTTSSGNSDPRYSDRVLVGHEPNNDIWQYTLNGEDLLYKESVVDDANYNSLAWTTRSPNSLLRKSKSISIKTFPGIGAIGCFTLLSGESTFVTPIHVGEEDRTKAPTLAMTDNGQTLTFVITPPSDVYYKCYRILLQNGNYVDEHITYNRAVTVVKPTVIGTYTCYCIGYTDEGGQISTASNTFTFVVTEGSTVQRPTYSYVTLDRLQEETQAVLNKMTTETLPDAVQNVLSSNNIRGIDSVSVSYGVSASSTEPPECTSTVPLTPADGSYLWTKIVYNYSDGACSVPAYSVARQGVVGTTWHSGTGITGSADTASIFINSGVTNAVIGDQYLNTSTGSIYTCVVAGTAAIAKWVYSCSIKGADSIALSISASNGVVFKSPNGSTQLTAHIFIAGLEHPIDADGTCGTLGTANWYLDGKLVSTSNTITVNARDVTSVSTYTCKIECAGQPAKAIATSTLSFLVDIQSVSKYYKLLGATEEAPTAPTTLEPTSWLDTEPEYTGTSDDSLYIVERTLYSNGDYEYSTVSKSMSYEAAKAAAQKAQTVFDAYEAGELDGDDAVILQLDSSRGTVFKNNNMATVICVIIYKGEHRITTMDELRSVFGISAYLQWYWQRLEDNTFGTILSTDRMLSHDGFMLSISASEVDTKCTFRCELIID